MSTMADKSRLLEQIRDGVKLRSVKTVDKSKPLILAENESLKNLTGTAASCPQPPPLPVTFGNRKNGNLVGADRVALMNEIRAGIKLRHIDAPLVFTQARTSNLGSSKALTCSKQQEEKRVTSNSTVTNAAHAAVVRQVVAELKTTNTFHSPLRKENDQNADRDVSLQRLYSKQATTTFSAPPDSFPLANSVSEQQKLKEKDVTISVCPDKSPAKMRSEMKIQLRCSRSKQPFDSFVGKTVKVNKKSSPVNLVSAKSFMAVTLKEPAVKNSPWSFQTVRVSPKGGTLPGKKSSALSVHSNGKTIENSAKLLNAFAESRRLDNRTQRPEGLQSSLSGMQSDQGKRESSGSSGLHSTKMSYQDSSTAFKSGLADNNVGGYPVNGTKQQIIKSNLCELGLAFPGLHDAANEGPDAFRGIRFEIDVDDQSGSFLKVQRCPET
ncbi:hypothetical protein D918_06592 [Trichuris suis]|nr:hypothetical protein D918_06592 [Trichuris suis]